MRVTTAQFMKRCGCRSSADCWHNTVAPLKALDRLVSEFAKAMKAKLQDKLLDGRGGWDDSRWTINEIKKTLREHIPKGDPVDVANFAAFRWNKTQEPPHEEGG